MLPTYLQLLCIVLDFYLITKLQPGMARNYLIFSLVRSLIRAYAQWQLPAQTWALVYWWGEGVGYIITIMLIFDITSHLLIEHINTSLFYTLAGLFMTIIALWNLPYPLNFLGLLRTGNIARGFAAFLLLMAIMLSNRWDPMTRWLGWGIVINLAAQIAGGWFELRLGPTVEVSLTHQLGFLCLQLAWLVGLMRAKPTDSSLIARLGVGL